MNLNVSIPYKSKKHRNILQALKDRKRKWANDSASRREKWREDTKIYQGFVHESDDDRLRKAAAVTTGEQQYTQVEIPYSYGLVMAFHTYLASVFLARTPVQQFQDRHGANQNNTQAIEAVMDYQTSVGKHLVPYYIWLMDATKHGLGVVGTYWESEVVRVSKIVEETPSFGGFSIPGRAKKVKRTIEVPGYKGNKLYNVRPADFIFDTRKSLADFQDGEFAGRMLDLSWLDVSDGAEDGEYINVDALKKKHADSSGVKDADRDWDDDIVEMPQTDNTLLGDSSANSASIPHTGIIEGFELHVRLVPYNWHLGQSKKSEKWVFTVADDVIIEARPFGELHNTYPFGIIETEIDGHALFKRSMLEIAEPLNNVMTWLVNTHFFNIRKSLNNMFVGDPTKLVMKDFKNPEQGLMIRLRPEAYGQNIDTMLKQLTVHDVTATHMQDTKIIAELLQQTLGVNAQLMGMLQGGGRKTATEVRGSTGFSMNRLKTQAEYISAMGFAPLSQILVQSTQQHLDIERMYRLTGDLLPQTGKQSILVGPEAIAGFWDYVQVDGTMPVDKLALANLWKEIMLGVGQNEQLMAQYDIGSIFAYTAQLSGAKNISRFKIQVTPDEQIQQGVQAGNLIPTGGQQNARVSTEAFTPRPGKYDGGRLEDTAGRVNDPKQLSGVGPLS